MNFLAGLFGGGEALAKPIEAVGNVVDELFTSDEERLTKEEAKLRLQQKPHIAQAEISKIEASHRSPFVAGARPFIMWVCGFSLLFIFIINPVIQWTTGEAGPAMETEATVNLILALIGLGTLRTVEKLRGKTT